MKKTALLILLAALQLTGEKCDNKAAAMYDESLGKWKESGVVSYTMKVSYRAFSPQQGLWELEVKHGKVASASFNGVKDAKYVRPAEGFTVDAIFKKAEGARGGDSDGPMVMTAEFSDVCPFIKSVKRLTNDRATGEVIKDTGFSIVIEGFKRSDL